MNAAPLSYAEDAGNLQKGIGDLWMIRGSAYDAIRRDIYRIDEEDAEFVPV